jgi:tripartite-type tricarboxylate transporter receptor subunit TctC
LLARALGTNPDFITYRGAAPVMVDIMGNHVDVFCAQTADAISNVQGRTVKGYIVTGPSRLTQLPQLPTSGEMQLGGSEISVWHGLFVPPGVPPAIQRSLEAALNRALDSAMIKERFASLGIEPTPAARRGAGPLAALIASEVPRWKALVADMKITPE